MYRIRFHSRGGQGIKTAGRILGTTFFMEGFTEASDGVIQLITNLQAQEERLR